MRRPWLGGVLMPVAVLVLYFEFPFGAQRATAGVAVGVALSALALAAVTYVLAVEVRRSDRRLGPFQLLLALEIVVMVFATVYYLLGGDRPQQFEGLSTRLDALYFSMTTLTTVGYGDVHPVGQLARGVVTAQLAFNLVFVAAFAGLLRDRLGSARDTDAAPSDER